MSIRENLYRAAITCRHEITKDQIVLYADTSKEGNALSQLADRLEQSVKQLEQELAEAKAMNKAHEESIANYANAVTAYKTAIDAYEIKLEEAKKVLLMVKNLPSIQKRSEEINQGGWDYLVNQLDAVIKESK